jgi:hypothetical protein
MWEGSCGNGPGRLWRFPLLISGNRQTEIATETGTGQRPSTEPSRTLRIDPDEDDISDYLEGGGFWKSLAGDVTHAAKATVSGVEKAGTAVGKEATKVGKAVACLLRGITTTWHVKSRSSTQPSPLLPCHCSLMLFKTICLLADFKLFLASENAALASFTRFMQCKRPSRTITT